MTVNPPADLADVTRSPAAARVEMAAIELFYERGFRSTSVRDIMSACNLTSAAFYNHFATKDALLYEIARRTHDLCDQYLYQGLGAANEPRGQLWHLTRAIAKFHAVHAKRARVTSEDFRALLPQELEDIRERRRRVRLMFEYVLAEGMRKNVFDVPRLGGERAARLLATTITNMTIRIAEWYRPELGLSADDIASFHADVALRMTHDNGESAYAPTPDIH